MLKKAIGWLILFAIFATLFVYMTLNIGVIATLNVFFIVAVIVAAVWFAATLIAS